MTLWELLHAPRSNSADSTFVQVDADTSAVAIAELTPTLPEGHVILFLRSVGTSRRHER